MRTTARLAHRSARQVGPTRAAPYPGPCLGCGEYLFHGPGPCGEGTRPRHFL